MLIRIKAFVRALRPRTGEPALRFALRVARRVARRPDPRVLLVAGAAALFAAVAADVWAAGGLNGMDAAVGAWFRAHRVADFTPSVLAFTHLHGTLGISILALGLGLVLAWKRHRAWLLTLAVVLPAGMLLNVLLKRAFMRDRPAMDEAVLMLSTYSFPSGHVAGAALFYGVLAAYLCSVVGSRRSRAVIVVAAGTMVVLVALSRLYLGVHYFSDVVVAVAWSAAWLALCLLAVDALAPVLAPAFAFTDCPGRAPVGSGPRWRYRSPRAGPPA